MERLKVAQVAKKLGVSNQAVYQRLARADSELTPHVSKEDRITYVDEEGVAILTRIFGNSKPESVSSVDKHVDPLVESVVASLRMELDQKQRVIEAQQATINTLITEHSEAQRRNDTIVLKLTNDVGAVKKQLEYREQLTQTLGTPPAPLKVWTPPQRIDPLKGKSWPVRVYAYLFQPELLRTVET